MVMLLRNQVLLVRAGSTFGVRLTQQVLLLLTKPNSFQVRVTVYNYSLHRTMKIVLGPLYQMQQLHVNLRQSILLTQELMQLFELLAPPSIVLLIHGVAQNSWVKTRVDAECTFIGVVDA